MNALMMTDEQILELGFEALVDKLGPVGMIRFIHHFDEGTGNYTEDRYQWLEVSNVETLAQQTQQTEDNTEYTVKTLNSGTEKEPDEISPYAVLHVHARDWSSPSDLEKTEYDLTTADTEKDIRLFYIEDQIQTLESLAIL
jgi:hypothetical protein